MEKEALQAQLDGIKKIIVDSDGTMPVSGKSFVVWGFISTALFLTMPVLSKFGLIAYIYMFTLIFIGLYLSKKHTDEINREKERILSKHQEIVGFVFLSNVLLGGFLTTVLAINLQGNYIISVWFVLMGVFDFLLGSFSKDEVKKFGIFFVILGLVFGVVLLFILNGADREFSGLISNISNFLGGIIFGLANIVLGKKLLKAQ